MTGGRKRASGLESADIGFGLRPKNIGARVKRVEDPRLLTGQGAFTADRLVPGALHVAFRRSDHAHSARVSAAGLGDRVGLIGPSGRVTGRLTVWPIP